MNHSGANDTLRAWTETASYWTKHRRTIRTMFEPLTRALIEDARIVEGQAILDVAGGAGEPSLTIAEIVGPQGSVVCTDPIAEMIAAAEIDARDRGLENVQFRQCAGDALPFADGSFDVVVCRLGAMFFPDPLAALSEMLRVVRPGGRVALAVWDKSELNPFCYIITNVLSRHVEAPPADPEAPNAFRFAEPGKLVGILEEAGAIDVTDRLLEFDVAAPISPADFWNLRSETSDTLRGKLRKLSGDEQAQIGAEVEDAVREFFPEGQMKFPTRMILVAGTAPHAAKSS
ncbi:MAG TPA: class I SAM-dependent methyltransferase [Pyrinomonadaceae bacterium]|nr:class I SAM-dependent methyltransferase [Pyrinomonadaceae bacterium]